MTFALDEHIASFSNSFNKFGSIHLQKIPSSLRLESHKGKQAQAIEKLNTIEDIVVKFVHSINATGDSITGCDFLPDGKVVMCNYPPSGYDFISVFEWKPLENYICRTELCI